MSEYDHPESSPPDPPDEAVAPSAARGAPGPGVPWRLTLFLVLTVLVVIFTVQNTQSIELSFLRWSWEFPIAVVILIAVVITIILDQILGGILKRRRLRLQREREELKRLRQSP
ncbi:hypothetical protein BH23ACT5_BH23ACT5_03400 [soil metagenome]